MRRTIVATLLLVMPAGAEPITIVTVGDSITKAVRPGVKPHETFSAWLKVDLQKNGIDANVINVGIGSEDTDLALARFDKDVIARKPKLVTIMYGANDHWIHKGKTEPKVSPEKFAANLKKMVADVRKAGGTPVLMTTPLPIGKAYPVDQANSLKRLEKYVQITRDVARTEKTPLVDHYAQWEAIAAKKEIDLASWVTDPWHPNAVANRMMAAFMLPEVLKALREGK